MQRLLQIVLALPAIAAPAALRAQPEVAEPPRQFWSAGELPDPASVAAPSTAPVFDGRIEHAAYVVPSGSMGESAAARPPHESSESGDGPIVLSRPREGKTIPLPGPGASHRGSSRGASGLSPIVTALGGLAVVVGLFFLVAWALRRAAPRMAGALPGEVFEVLGRAPLSGRQQVHLLRCGSKLLLVSVTPAGAETLTEITDANEVDRLAGLCEQARPGSATETFRQVLEQLTGHAGERELREAPAPGGQRAAGTGILAAYRQWEGRDV